jgi:hypothetical protein
MNQRTHAWIAIRAIRLLEDEGQSQGLVNLLKPYAKGAAIGAWIPDKRDAKLGTASTQNHIFKIGMYIGSPELKSRFIVDKAKMLKFLNPQRMIKNLIENNTHILDSNWWNQPYKAEAPPGKHLANRAMALSISNIDQILLGDTTVRTIIPYQVDFLDRLPIGIRYNSGQAALFFFMLSHFIADSLMPCHCDDRDLSDYDAGLHKELEAHWSDKIVDTFDEEKITGSDYDNEKILDLAQTVDTNFNVSFNNQVLPLKSQDVWEEVVMLCRASFAVASIIAPPDAFPYKPGSQVKTTFNQLFRQGQANQALLAELDRAVMHDAVVNVAMFWKDIWKKF